MSDLDSIAELPIDHAAILQLRDSASRAAALLKELSNEQRLLILCKLMEGECSVSYLSHHLDLSQSATSQHLARLRNSRLVSTRRDAQTIYYRLADRDAVMLLDTLCRIFAPDGAAKARGAGRPD